MTRGKTFYLILVHSDETRSMIPADWTDLSPKPEANRLEKVPRITALPMIATIDNLMRMRKKVDILLKQVTLIQKEKTDDCRTTDSYRSNGTVTLRRTSLEET
jgi:hypothetical protein